MALDLTWAAFSIFSKRVVDCAGHNLEQQQFQKWIFHNVSLETFAILCAQFPSFDLRVSRQLSEN